MRKNIILLGCILSLFFLQIFVGGVLAQKVKIDTLQGHSDVYDLSVESTKTQTEDMEKISYRNIYSTLVAFLGSAGPELTTMNIANLPGSMKKGLLGMAEQQVVTMLNSQPNIDVLAHLSEEWIPGYRNNSSVYASGYDDLVKSGISSLWSVTRNIAYLGFVLIMIIVGFMIMFRNKIGGQMMVTIGNTLPRIVVSLVLVTFSFALAGVLLDFAGVFMKVLGSASLLDSDIAPHKLLDMLKGVLGFTGISSLGFGTIIGIIVAVATGGPIGILAGSIIIVAIALVLIGIVVVGAIKLWLALLKSYFAVLVNVAISPIAIMMGALPGNDSSTINIFKSIFRNALVFPIAFAIVNLPYFIEKQANVRIGFPESLTGDPSSGGTKMGFFILAVAKIIAIYAAAQAPTIAKSIIPATASKSGVDTAAAVKAGLEKIPLVGGMFK